MEFQGGAFTGPDLSFAACWLRYRKSLPFLLTSVFFAFLRAGNSGEPAGINAN
jgi:hypothetical protein